MARKKPNPQQKAAVTRKANALFAKRSAAARKGWATRRRTAADKQLRKFARKPGGRNVSSSGAVQPYQVRKFGITFRGKRYDFRGLTAKRREAMKRLIVADAQGHYVRMLIATTNEAAYRRLTTSAGREMAVHLARQDPNKPYWFWTPEFGPIESTLEAFDHMVGIFEGEAERGEVRIMMVEIL